MECLNESLKLIIQTDPKTHGRFLQNLNGRSLPCGQTAAGQQASGSRQLAAKQISSFSDL